MNLYFVSELSNYKRHVQSFVFSCYMRVMLVNFPTEKAINIFVKSSASQTISFEFGIFRKIHDSSIYKSQNMHGCLCDILTFVCFKNNIGLKKFFKIYTLRAIFKAKIKQHIVYSTKIVFLVSVIVFEKNENSSGLSK